jgi:hypothetical protein
MKKVTPQERRRLRLKKAGLCQTCGQNPTGGKGRGGTSHCASCAEKVLAPRRKGTYCQTCGEAIPDRQRRCAEHARNDSALQAARANSRKAEGVCVQCGREAAVDGSIRGSKCMQANRTAAREAYRALRLKVVAIYGGRCVCCGEIEPDFLSLDHINNDGGQQRSGGNRSGSALYKYALKERPQDLQLLCYNCNCARGHYGVCPHKRGNGAFHKPVRPVGRRRIASV